MRKEEAYKILGVGECASKEEIKREYRRKVKKYHPDRGGESTKFIKIQEAYELLKGLVGVELTHESIIKVRVK